MTGNTTIHAPQIKFFTDPFDAAIDRLIYCGKSEPDMVQQFLDRTESRQLFELSTPADKFNPEIIMVFVSPSKRLTDFIERLTEAIYDKRNEGAA